MPARPSSRAKAKPVAAPKKAPAKSRPLGSRPLGALPEWNLADLYPGTDTPEVKRDLDRADQESAGFEETYKGKLIDIGRSPDAGRALAAAVKPYEAIDDLMGRLMSYASLVYAGNTADPV